MFSETSRVIRHTTSSASSFSLATVSNGATGTATTILLGLRRLNPGSHQHRHPRGNSIINDNGHATGNVLNRPAAEIATTPAFDLCYFAPLHALELSR
ncbi:hypothetical protein JL39_10510 [Rhizobium sp. YS-1r]|nr:hypothetical protein JL39_10510 [Rhizobium sp. YS-1r]